MFSDFARRLRPAHPAWLLFALLLFSHSQGSAQVTLTGTVVDADDGLGVPGANIVVEDAVTGGAITDAQGAFNIDVDGLPATLIVSHVGYETKRVVVSENVAIEIALQILAVEVAELVVVGSRAEARSVTESMVPVDVITGEEFVAQGTADLANQLRTVVPSFNINIQPISDAATIVRPANLRNLAPDHTLVLVNGKRRHRAAVIAWLGNGIADGSQGPDVSVIPSIAIQQAEVLRDGAAAQYGSDAIAGVLNFRLRNAREGGSLEFRTGAHRDANPGDASTCGEGIIGDIKHSCNGIGGRGQAFSIAGNVGLPLGPNGFANLSVEYGNAKPTSRSIQRNDARAIIGAGNANVRNTAQVWGSPLVENDLKLFGNFGYLFDNGMQFYGHTNYASRKVTGGFYFRNPHTRGGVFRGPVVEGQRTLLVGDRVWAQTGVPGAGNCPTIPIINDVPDAAALKAVEDDPNCFTLYSRFPGGFTPQFGGDLVDYSLVGGLRGSVGDDLIWDASVNIGTSDVDQFIYDTVNASLGYGTPTSFNPGSYRQDDVNFNLDVSYPINEMVNLAAGAEWRTEQFTIGAGDRASWEIGPYAEQGFSSGSNGFNGYREDTTAGQWSRRNIAAYADLQLDDPDGQWTAGAAVRVEDFEDFGTTTNGKVSARARLTDALSLRAAVSTGFRAPTPGQQNAFNVTTAFIGGQLTNNGVVPSTSKVAVARGGEQLQPEKSRNYSAGAVVERGPFTFTADFFRIDIDDRLALAQEIELTESEIETLLQEGITEARNFPVFRFFLNDFSTTTQGIDLISTLAVGRTTFSAVFNYTGTTLKNLQADSAIDDFRVYTLEQGLPKTRWNLTANHTADRWSAMGRLSYFGSFWDSEDGRNAADLGVVSESVRYPAYSGKALLDVEVGIPLVGGATLAVGAENVLNAYPEENKNGADTVGNQYGQFSPFGFNGTYYYTRIGYAFGTR